LPIDFYLLNFNIDWEEKYNRVMKKEVIMRSSVLFGVALVVVVVCFGQGQQISGDDIVAEVNGMEITVNDMMAELNRLSPEVQQQIIQDPNGRNQLLNSIISKKLLVAKAKSLGIDTLDFVKQAVQRSAEDIYVQVLLNEVRRQNTQVTDEEAKQWYQQNDTLFDFDYRYHISQLVLVDKEVAEDVLSKLKKGKLNWDEAVKKYPGTANNRSGDGGWMFKNNIVPAAREAIANLKPGEMSEVIQIGSVYYIIKLMDMEEPRKASFEEVKNNIMQILANQKAQDATTQYQNNLLNQAKISIDNSILNQVSFTPQGAGGQPAPSGQ